MGASKERVSKPLHISKIQVSRTPLSACVVIILFCTCPQADGEKKKGI